MIRYMTLRQFRRVNGECLAVHRVNDDGEHIIELPYHASTLTRLHELGHKHFNHNPNEPTTLDDLFNREVAAEIYAYHRADKRLSYKVLLPAIQFVNSYHILNVCELFKLCMDALQELDIPYNKEDKSYIWHILKDIAR